MKRYDKNEDQVFYKYGLPLNESQIDDPEICDFYRKVFLVASFPVDFLDEVAEAICLGRKIDEELFSDTNSLFENNTTTLKTALEFIKNWIQLKKGKMRLPELYEFKTFHKIPDDDMDPIITDIASNLYNTPARIKSYLDTIVIGQEEAKKVMSISFYIHLVRIGKIRSVFDNDREYLLENFPKPNILISGSTGSGKTFIITTLCNLFRIPFIKIDCSSLVSSGYVGNNLNTYLKMLIDKHGLDKARQAILYFDEFDKVSEANIGRNGSIGGIELQQEFLTLLEDKYLTVRKEKSGDDHWQLDSGNLMLVFSGSFSGIESIIKKRIQDKSNFSGLGYHKNEQPIIENPIKKLNFDDLIKFGIIPELVGRIGFIAVLDKLTKEELISIIKKSKNNVLDQYNNYFRFTHDELIIKDEVYDLIAEESLRRNIGARALNGVIFQLLRDLLYESVNTEVQTFVIDADYFRLKVC